MMTLWKIYQMTEFRGLTPKSFGILADLAESPYAISESGIQKQMGILHFLKINKGADNYITEFLL